MRRWTGGAAYLVLGAAGAALIGWLGYAFTITVQRASGVDRALVIALAVLTASIAAGVLLSASVRDAEVAMAGPLLGVRLPPVRDRQSWASRRRGAAWACWVLLVGAVAALVLLIGVPTGAGLAAGGDGAQFWWRMPLGILIALGSFAVQALFCILLASTAPKILGPTPADRLAFAAEREQDLARSNELARELHDTIGHSLTAISVQAEAGQAVGAADPRAAMAALERIGVTAVAALNELDAVLGSLRSEQRGRTAADLAALVHAATTSEPSILEIVGDWEALPGEVTGVVFRIAQEALTNAVKHGAGSARVRVVMGATATVTVTNPTSGQQDSSQRKGHGLLGLQERVTLVGGSVEAGASPDGKEWKLCARLPIP